MDSLKIIYDNIELFQAGLPEFPRNFTRDSIISAIIMVESMMSGTPAIAFNKGSVPEVVEHGKTGYLVKNIEEMIEAVEESVKISPLKCRELAVKKFGKDKMIEDYIKIYKELV